MTLSELVRRAFFDYSKLPAEKFYALGPNELSICDVDAVAPLMGNLGLPKGQCK